MHAPSEPAAAASRALALDVRGVERTLPAFRDAMHLRLDRTVLALREDRDRLSAELDALLVGRRTGDAGPCERLSKEDAAHLAALRRSEAALKARARDLSAARDAASRALGATRAALAGATRQAELLSRALERRSQEAESLARRLAVAREDLEAERRALRREREAVGRLREELRLGRAAAEEERRRADESRGHHRAALRASRDEVGCLRDEVAALEAALTAPTHSETVAVAEAEELRAEAGRLRRRGAEAAAETRSLERAVARRDAEAAALIAARPEAQASLRPLAASPTLAEPHPADRLMTEFRARPAPAAGSLADEVARVNALPSAPTLTSGRFRAPEVSVIVEAGEGAALLQTVEALLRQATPAAFEIVLRDAPPALDALRRVRRVEAGPGARLGDLAAPGAACAAVLPAGAWPAADWLAALLAGFAFSPDVQAVGSLVLDADGRVREAGLVADAPDGAWRRGGAGDDPAAPAHGPARDVEGLGEGAAFRLVAATAEAPLHPPTLCAQLRRAGLRVRLQPAARMVAVAPLRELGSAPGDHARLAPKSVLVVGGAPGWRDPHGGVGARLKVARLYAALGYDASLAPLHLSSFDADVFPPLQAEGLRPLYAVGGGSLNDHLVEAGTGYAVVHVLGAQTLVAMADALERWAPRARLVADVGAEPKPHPPAVSARADVVCLAGGADPESGGDDRASVAACSGPPASVEALKDMLAAAERVHSPSDHEDVVNAYRLAFGRDPESDTVSAAKMGLPMRILAREVFAAPEFHSRFLAPLLHGGGCVGEGAQPIRSPDALRVWAARRLPLLRSARWGVANSRSTSELMLRLLRDPIFREAVGEEIAPAPVLHALAMPALKRMLDGGEA